MLSKLKCDFILNIICINYNL